MMEDFHKRRRQRENERNKKRKIEARRVADMMKDPDKILEEIRRLESLDTEGKLDDSSRNGMENLRRKHNTMLKRQEEEKVEHRKRATLEKRKIDHLHNQNFALYKGREVRIGGTGDVPLPPPRPMVIPPPPAEGVFTPLRSIPKPPPRGLPPKPIPPPPTREYVPRPRKPPIQQVPIPNVNTGPRGAPVDMHEVEKQELDGAEYAALIDTNKLLQKQLERSKQKEAAKLEKEKEKKKASIEDDYEKFMSEVKDL